jgi:organic radical activating enzyme
MYGNTSNLDLVRERLNAVSPSFCLAKWKHLTLHLLNGTNHSCYLPPVHKIPLNEIEADPSALHNTTHKKNVRRDMLAGRRPSECQTCWTVEDLPGSQTSDRIIRGNETWTRPYFDEVKNLPWDANVQPAYMEVSFSNLCNFKCSYCSPHVSSKWHEEIKEHGPYQLNTIFQSTTDLARLGLMPIEDEDTNPYIKAFWKWWPDVSKQLKVFRITGGEPLLSKHTFKVLDWFAEHPSPQLDLNVNSNLGIPEKIYSRFLDRVEELLANGKIGRFKIHTSLDNFGDRAEYIRHGLDFSRFQKHVHEYLRRMPSGDLAFMSTFNILSVVGYENFLDWILELRGSYQKNGRSINFDTPHLVGPRHQSVRLLTDDYHERMKLILNFMQDRSSPKREDAKFRPIEIEKMRRVFELMRQPYDVTQLGRDRNDFYLFFKEHDRRRGTDFLKIFPEMTDFWNLARGSCTL